MKNQNSEFDRRSFKITSLERQIDLLDTWQGRHLVWASDTADSETKSKHLKIAYMLHDVRNQCFNLLELYNKQKP